MYSHLLMNVHICLLELEALEMEKMMLAVQSWMSPHNKCAFKEERLNIGQESVTVVHFLIVEGFLLYHYE